MTEHYRAETLGHHRKLSPSRSLWTPPGNRSLDALTSKRSLNHPGPMSSISCQAGQAAGEAGRHHPCKIDIDQRLGWPPGQEVLLSGDPLRVWARVSSPPGAADPASWAVVGTAQLGWEGREPDQRTFRQVGRQVPAVAVVAAGTVVARWAYS
jgi:hypothetical protein